MTKNTPHTLWPHYSDDIYFSKYHLAHTKNNPLTNFLSFEISSNKQIVISLTELVWDTNHFGFKCYKLEVISYDEGIILNATDMQTIISKFEQYLTKNKIRFVFADINSTDVFQNQFVQYLKFKFIVNWLDGFIETKKYTDSSISQEPRFLLSKADINFYKELANKFYYKGGRFYSDKNFDIKKVNEIYVALIENSVKDGSIIIADNDKGVNTGIVISKNIINYEYAKTIKVAHLRFMISNPEHRGTNIGEKLIRKAILHLKDQCEVITTGVETHNLHSLNLHCKIGFKYNYCHNAYHYWNDNI